MDNLGVTPPSGSRQTACRAGFAQGITRLHPDRKAGYSVDRFYSNSEACEKLARFRSGVAAVFYRDRARKAMTRAPEI